MTITNKWLNSENKNSSYPATLSLEHIMNSEQFKKNKKKSEVDVDFNMYDTSKTLTRFSTYFYLNENQMKYIKKGKEIFYYDDNNNQLSFGLIEYINTVMVNDDNSVELQVYLRSPKLIFYGDSNNFNMKLYTTDWLGSKTYFRGRGIFFKDSLLFFRSKSGLPDTIEFKLSFDYNSYNIDTATKSSETYSHNNFRFFKSKFKLPNSEDSFYLTNFNGFITSTNSLLCSVDNLKINITHVKDILGNSLDLSKIPRDKNNNLILERNINDSVFGNLSKKNIKLTSFKYNNNIYCVGAFHEFIPILNHTIGSFKEPEINNLGQRVIINNYPEIPLCKCKKSGAELNIENISRIEDIIIFSINKEDSNYNNFIKLNKIYELSSNLNFNKNQIFYDLNGNINTYDSVDMYHIRLFNSDKHYKQSSSCILNKNDMLEGIVVGSEISNHIDAEKENHDIYNNFNNLNINKYNNHNNIIYMVPIKSIIRCLNKEKLKDLPLRINYNNFHNLYYTSRDSYSTILNISDGDKSYSINKFTESIGLTSYNYRLMNITNFNDWKDLEVLNLIPLDNNAKYGARNDGAYLPISNDQIILDNDPSQDAYLKNYAKGAIIIISRGITSFEYKRDFCKTLGAKAMIVVNNQKGNLSMGGNSDNLLSISIDNNYMKFFEKLQVTGSFFNLNVDNFYQQTGNKEWEIEYKFKENDEYIKVNNYSTFDLINIDENYSSFGIIDRFNYEIDYSKPVFIKIKEYMSDDYFNQQEKEEKEFILDWEDFNNFEDKMIYPIFKLTNINFNKSDKDPKLI